MAEERGKLHVARRPIPSDIVRLYVRARAHAVTLAWLVRALSPCRARWSRRRCARVPRDVDPALMRPSPLLVLFDKSTDRVRSVSRALQAAGSNRAFPCAEVLRMACTHPLCVLPAHRATTKRCWSAWRAGLSRATLSFLASTRPPSRKRSCGRATRSSDGATAAVPRSNSRRWCALGDPHNREGGGECQRVLTLSRWLLRAFARAHTHARELWAGTAHLPVHPRSGGASHQPRVVGGGHLVPPLGTVDGVTRA